MKLAGLSLAEIAARLNYPSAGAVAKSIKDQLIADAKEVEPETRETLLGLELERLNYAQSRIWMQVEAGDIKAIDTMLKIIQVRMKLQGLDMVDVDRGAQTVLVISGSEADYIKKLKELAGD